MKLSHRYDSIVSFIFPNFSVRYEESLNMAKFLMPELTSEAMMYELCCVLVHTGSLDSGHYFALLKVQCNISSSATYY